jgi:hypothetical protein
MNFQNQLEDFHNDNLNKLAERISALITSINDKKKNPDVADLQSVTFTYQEHLTQKLSEYEN